ncbi:unnamed protein product, partial [Sphacelaria rigidula]
SKGDAVGEFNSSSDGIERWIADSGETFHVTKSAEMLCDVQPSEDKVKIGSDTLIDGEGYGSLIVVCPRKGGVVIVRLEKTAYVPDLLLTYSH